MAACCHKHLKREANNHDSQYHGAWFGTRSAGPANKLAVYPETGAVTIE
jgi:hypothetical protein